MKISIIGSGYVGLVTGACLAELGNHVICVDNDVKKIVMLRKGLMPIFERGLKDLVRRNVRAGRLTFSSDIKAGVRKSDIIFICVGTPPRNNGEADLTFIEAVARQIALAMPSYRLIVEKSTVPVNTGRWVEKTISAFNRRNIPFDVASNPEFLREGSAIEDFFHPDRLVIGARSKKARDILTKLYKPLRAPIVFTNIEAAELIKHASNSFLAMKISFINAVANICDKVGADIAEVRQGVGYDKRIGQSFLSAGIGFGGSCFPKDLAAFIKISEKLDYDMSLLKEVEKINSRQKFVVKKKIEQFIWNLSNKTITVLGLSFKPDTDDLRSSPSLDLIKLLLAEGARVKVYDPQAMPKAKKILGKTVKFCGNVYSAAKDSDCVIVATEWREFAGLDLKRLKAVMAQPVLIDGRNIYDPDKARKLGFKYAGMGRS